jgi:hypothetical protein
VGDNKSKSYMWLYGCGADSPEGKIVVSAGEDPQLFAAV